MLAARAARAADRGRALRRRAAQPRARTRTSRTSARTRSRTRPGCTPPACARESRGVRAHRPGARRQPQRRARLRARRPRDRRREGRGRRASRSTRSRVIERVKALEHAGYQFEAADGSFELLLRKEAGVYEPLFRLESWRCIVEQRADGKVETEATIKIWVDGERYVRTAEGNGPVNALDAALRSAIAEIHPHLRDIELVNFKVRILDETKGTGAVTRVLLDASDGQDLWGSIGVHENVIAASWQALVDSIELPMQPGKPSTRARATRPSLRDPARQAGPRRARGGARPRGARSGQLSLGPDGCRGSSTAFAARLGVAHASRGVVAAPPGLHLALRAVGVARRRRGHHVAVLVRRVARTSSLYERATAGVRRHRPA